MLYCAVYMMVQSLVVCVKVNLSRISCTIVYIIVKNQVVYVRYVKPLAVPAVLYNLYYATLSSSVCTV